MKTHPMTHHKQRAKGRAIYSTCADTGDATLRDAIADPSILKVRTCYVIYPDEYEQAVERMARAIAENHGIEWNARANKIAIFDDVRAALKSIDIAAPRTERKTL